MVVNSKNSVLLCITLYSLLLRETLWYSVVLRGKTPPSSLPQKKSFFFFVLHAVPLYFLHLLIVRTPNQLLTIHQKNKS